VMRRTLLMIAAMMSAGVRVAMPPMLMSDPASCSPNHARHSGVAAAKRAARKTRNQLRNKRGAR